LQPSAFDQPFRELSGGELQRVYMAMAVSSQPDVLLLDEPTSALDRKTQESIEQSLKGKTCLWATHDPAQVDRVSDSQIELT